ncbi:hypothetical protein O8B93_06835 [Agrobacterium rhizogenes]|uniref:hypothetical protein n=1 Tax=Rhizobium rhizogenes TaxID=359 RepID=UPI0022B72098|nr:hypothetical protein [Rhizobium rhizogenes]MCZ7447301.1 hypothetical protein [Rhizobium rhizogenes]
MPFKPSYEDLVLRDGIASLPEMENIQLELPLPRQADAENRVEAGLEPDPVSAGTTFLE